MAFFKSIDDIPYHCPRCGSTRNFTTLLSLQSHLIRDHSPMYRDSLYDAYVYPSQRSRSSSFDLLDQYSKEAKVLEKQLQEAKEHELRNKLERLGVVPVSDLLSTLPRIEPPFCETRDTSGTRSNNLVLRKSFPGLSPTMGNEMQTVRVLNYGNYLPTASLHDELKLKNYLLEEKEKEIEDLKNVKEKYQEHEIDNLKLNLRLKGAHLDNAERELENLVIDGQKLRRQNVEISKQNDTFLQQIETLSQDVQDREHLIAQKDSEVQQLSNFLTRAAEKEAVARNKLEDFMNDLIEKTDKAQTKVKLLKKEKRELEESLYRADSSRSISPQQHKSPRTPRVRVNFEDGSIIDSCSPSPYRKQSPYLDSGLAESATNSSLTVDQLQLPAPHKGRNSSISSGRLHSDNNGIIWDYNDDENLHEKHRTSARRALPSAKYKVKSPSNEKFPFRTQHKRSHNQGSQRDNEVPNFTGNCNKLYATDFSVQNQFSADNVSDSDVPRKESFDNIEDGSDFQITPSDEQILLSINEKTKEALKRQQEELEVQLRLLTNQHKELQYLNQSSAGSECSENHPDMSSVRTLKDRNVVKGSIGGKKDKVDNNVIKQNQSKKNKGFHDASHKDGNKKSISTNRAKGKETSIPFGFKSQGDSDKKIKRSVRNNHKKKGDTNAHPNSVKNKVNRPIIPQANHADSSTSDVSPEVLADIESQIIPSVKSKNYKPNTKCISVEIHKPPSLDNQEDTFGCSQVLDHKTDKEFHKQDELQWPRLNETTMEESVKNTQVNSQVEISSGSDYSRASLKKNKREGSIKKHRNGSFRSQTSHSSLGMSSDVSVTSLSTGAESDKNKYNDDDDLSIGHSDGMSKSHEDTVAYYNENAQTHANFKDTLQHPSCERRSNEIPRSPGNGHRQNSRSSKHKPNRQSHKTVKCSKSEALFLVFKYLNTRNLSKMALICKQWRDVSRHPALWRRVVLAHGTMGAKYLQTILLWCSQVQHLTLEDLTPRRHYKKETDEEYNLAIHGCLESGIENLLRASQNTILSVNIVDCGPLVTERALWLISNYCQNLRCLTFVSDYDTVGPEGIWALGAGCGDLTSIIIPAFTTNRARNKFNNRCLQLMAKCWPRLKTLSVGGLDLDAQSLSSIGVCCPQLEWLELTCMKEINDSTVVHVCQDDGFRNLASLRIASTPIQPDALLRFKRMCPQLKSIHVQIKISHYFKDMTSKKNVARYDATVQRLKELKRTDLAGILTYVS